MLMNANVIFIYQHVLSTELLRSEQRDDFENFFPEHQNWLCILEIFYDKKW